MDRRQNHPQDHRRPRQDRQYRRGLSWCRALILIPFFIVTVNGSRITVNAQTPVLNNAFAPGEKLKFKVYYQSKLTGKVTAGVATLEVKTEKKTVEGRRCYDIIGEGKSKGAFDFFFSVDDKFGSFVDEEYLLPWEFTRKTHEGDYRKEDRVVFHQYNNTVSSSRANKPVPAGTRDILSAFYFARTYDFTNATPGDRFPITFFLDDSVYVSVIQFAGKEEIETSLGKIRCLRFKPMVITGSVFSQPYPMDLWISDDKNHIPVLARSAVIVGAIKMELNEYKGLRNAFEALIAKP
jgi:hypothetical protein